MDLFAMLTTNQLPCEECARTLLMQTMGSEPSFVLTSFTKWAIGTPPSLTSWATLLSSTKQQTDSMDKGGSLREIDILLLQLTVHHHKRRVINAFEYTASPLRPDKPTFNPWYNPQMMGNESQESHDRSKANIVLTIAEGDMDLQTQPAVFTQTVMDLSFKAG